MTSHYDISEQDMTFWNTRYRVYIVLCSTSDTDHMKTYWVRNYTRVSVRFSVRKEKCVCPDVCAISKMCVPWNFLCVPSKNVCAHNWLKTQNVCALCKWPYFMLTRRPNYNWPWWWTARICGEYQPYATSGSNQSHLSPLSIVGRGSGISGGLGHRIGHQSRWCDASS